MHTTCMIQDNLPIQGSCLLAPLKHGLPSVSEFKMEVCVFFYFFINKMEPRVIVCKNYHKQR